MTFGAVVLATAFGLLAVLAITSERMFGSLSVARVGIALCLFTSVAALGYLASRRLAVSALAGVIVVAGLGAISKAKFAYVGATLHSLDLYVYLGAPTELAFFAWHQPGVTAIATFAISLIALTLVALTRREGRAPWPRLAALPVAILPLLPAAHFAASPRLQEQMQHGHFYDGYHLTSWFLSLFRPIDNDALAANFPGTAANGVAQRVFLATTNTVRRNCRLGFPIRQSCDS